MPPRRRCVRACVRVCVLVLVCERKCVCACMCDGLGVYGLLHLVRFFAGIGFYAHCICALQALSRVRDISDGDGVDSGNFGDVFGASFVTALSDGREVELCPGGAERRVSLDNRAEYVALSLARRMEESADAARAVVGGLASQVRACAAAGGCMRACVRGLCVRVCVRSRRRRRTGGVVRAGAAGRRAAALVVATRAPRVRRG